MVGQSNRFASAAAMAVAEQPGAHYNPLFIYGGAGLGKTHLLNAVGHQALEMYPDLVVRYVSSENFLNDFIESIRRKRPDDFKSRYRSVDILLLDDVQFFEGKEQILEEFFHTFNSLYESGKQMVISSDRHPRNLSSLEDRLRSRFEWGLLTDIQPPDVETRLAILRRNAEFAPRPVPVDVLEHIAGLVSDNIRELEGALTRVTAWSALNRRDIDLETAERVLKDIVASDEPVPLGPETIIRTTATCLRVLGRGRVELEPAPAPRPLPPDLDVSLSRADRPVTSQDRRALQPGSHHGVALRGEGEADPEVRSSRVRPGQPTHTGAEERWWPFPRLLSYPPPVPRSRRIIDRDTNR